MNEHDKKQDQKREATMQKPAKQPFVPPRVVVHGSLAEITRGAKMGTSDALGLTATGL